VLAAGKSLQHSAAIFTAAIAAERPTGA